MQKNTIYDFINLSKYAKRTQTTTNFDCGENARDARSPKKQRQRQSGNNNNNTNK